MLPDFVLPVDLADPPCTAMLNSLPPMGLTPMAFDPAGRVDTSRPPAAADTEDKQRVTPKPQAQGLDDSELATLRALQQRDREVRAHEMAHVAVGGPLVLRGAQFEYQTGPDGVRYAIGGDVLIDTSPAPTPEETLDKAQRIRATALAPAEPSPQDHQVAAMAMQMAMQAQMEIASQRSLENASGSTTTNDAPQPTRNPPTTDQITAAYGNADGTRINTPGRLIDVTS